MREPRVRESAPARRPRAEQDELCRHEPQCGEHQDGAREHQQPLPSVAERAEAPARQERVASGHQREVVDDRAGSGAHRERARGDARAAHDSGDHEPPGDRQRQDRRREQSEPSPRDPGQPGGEDQARAQQRRERPEAEQAVRCRRQRADQPERDRERDEAPGGDVPQSRREPHQRGGEDDRVHERQRVPVHGDQAEAAERARAQQCRAGDGRGPHVERASSAPAEHADPEQAPHRGSGLPQAAMPGQGARGLQEQPFLIPRVIAERNVGPGGKVGGRLPEHRRERSITARHRPM